MRDATSQGEPASFSDALGQAIAERGVSLEYLRGRPAGPRHAAQRGDPELLALRAQPARAPDLARGARPRSRSCSTCRAGTCARGCGPRSARVRSGAAKSLAYLMGGSEAVRRALEQLGYDPDATESLVETSVQVTFDVDDQGRGRSAVSRSVWKAVRDGARGHRSSSRWTPRARRCRSSWPSRAARSGRPTPTSSRASSASRCSSSGRWHTARRPSPSTRCWCRSTPTPDPFYEIYLTRRLSEAVLWVQVRRRQGARALRGLHRGPADTGTARCCRGGGRRRPTTWCATSAPGSSASAGSGDPLARVARLRRPGWPNLTVPPRAAFTRFGS